MQQALVALSASGFVPGVVEAVEAMAGLAVDTGDFARAPRLFGASASIRANLGYRRFTCCEDSYGDDLAVARAGHSQGREGFEKEGASLAYGELLEFAREGRGDQPL